MDFPNPLDGIKSAGEAIQGFAGNVANAASEAASQIGGATNGLAAQIGNAAGDAMSQAGKVAGEVVSQAGKVAGEAATQAGKTAEEAVGAISNGIEGAKRDFDQKKSMNFQSVEALQPVVNVVNEAAAALNDKSRTIGESAIPEVLGGALGATAGGIASFAALYGLGTVGLSAAGMTSALATAGALVGGGMAAGVFVLAAPVAIGAGVGIGLAAKLKADQLSQEKERLYKEALRKHQAIIQALKDEADASKERLDYLQSLNVLLTKAVNDLRADLGK